MVELVTSSNCKMRYSLLLLAFCPAILNAALLGTKRKGSDILIVQPIIDGHNDLPYNLRDLENNQLANFNFSSNLNESDTWNCPYCFTDLPRLRAGRVGAQFWVAFVMCSSQYKDAVEQTLEQIDVIKRLIQAYPDDLTFATSADEIEAAIADGKIASLICVEGGHSIDSRLSVLRLMYEMGARYLTLTHSCNTPWADSSPTDGVNGVVEHDGLSVWGKSVIKELNRLGMMVDLSHVSAKTMKDALAVTEAPVIFSHSSAWELCNHHRNVRDDVLRLVTINDGLVMVNFYSGFIQCDKTKNATIDDVVDHINHIRNVAGPKHVGIGGDYDGVDEVPLGLEDVSKYPDLFDKLAESEVPWTDDELKDLAGRNLLRVMRAVEAKRDEWKETERPVEELIPEQDLGKNTQCRTDIADSGSSGIRQIGEMMTFSLMVALAVRLLL